MGKAFASFSAVLAFVSASTAPASATGSITINLRAQVSTRCSLMSTSLSAARDGLDVAVICNAEIYRLSFRSSDNTRLDRASSRDASVSNSGDAVGVRSYRPGIQTIRIAFTGPLAPDAITAVELTTF